MAVQPMVIARITVPAFRERLYPLGKQKILNEWSMQELNWIRMESKVPMFNIISTKKIMVIGSSHGING